jgi:hypothetical protein
MLPELVKKSLDPFVGAVVSFFDKNGGCLDANLKYIPLDWWNNPNDFALLRNLGKYIEVQGPNGPVKLKTERILEIEEYNDQIHITWRV